jgi:hypothetical protein
MRIGAVEELFELSLRGLIVVLDTPIDHLPDDLKLRIGDPVEFRSAAGSVLKSTIAGIEHADPWTPKRKFAFLLQIGITKEQIPIGAEVWIMESTQHS